MSTYLSVNEAIKLILLGNNDLEQRSRMRYAKYAPYVWEDLKLNVLKQPVRETFWINKRTNTIDLPCPFTQVSSVNVRDAAGNFYPVWRNERLTDDIPDVSAGRDCSCEYKCGNKLCNTIKGYEAVVSEKTDYMPNGTAVSFSCVDRKMVDSNGFFIEQLQYPQRVYESGVWVDTILYTENKQLCAVELDHNGCVCDTEQNIDALCNTCCSDSSSAIPFGGTTENPPCNNENIETWKYYCNSKSDWFWYQCGCDVVCADPFKLIYNISELGNRLIFPKNFGFDRVVLRYYKETSTGDIKIPMIALDAFAMGIKWWDARFNDNKQNLAAIYSSEYTKMKWGLFSEMNKRRLAEWRMILTPPAIVPSYIKNNYYNGGNNNQNNYGY
jgi:hypothetical protein